MNERGIKGGRELDAALKALPAKLERNILRGALRAGGKVFLEAARARVPVKSGDLRASLRVRTGAKRGRVSAFLKAGDKKAWYAHLVEFGTRRHWIKPKARKSLFFAGIAKEVVDHPGAADKPFLRPAFEGNADDALRAIADYVRARLDKEARR